MVLYSVLILADACAHSLIIPTLVSGTHILRAGSELIVVVCGWFVEDLPRGRQRGRRRRRGRLPLRVGRGAGGGRGREGNRVQAVRHVISGNTSFNVII